ncbi:MAG: glycosyltransferase family 4 protein [Bdellovibrionaceae bacterium]|nr:glycosyltransferase family 4 protein [Pseudobdellovibrionaceae bacterium]
MLFSHREPLPSQLNIALISQYAPLTQTRTSGRLAGPSFLRLIARGLAFRGHNVTIITGESVAGPGGTTLEADGVRIVSLASPRSARHRALRASHQPRFQDLVRRRFLELHKETPFHLVHALDGSAVRVGQMKKAVGVASFAMAYDVQATSMADLFAIMGMGQETLGSILNTGLNVGVRFLSTYFGHDRRLLATADGVFVASPRERIALERYYLYPDAKVHTVPYGIEVNAARPSEAAEDAEKQNAPWNTLSESCKIAVTVSDMNDVGEMLSLLHAFEKVAIKKPNARLLIIGDGPRFKEIEFESLNLALGSKVIFTGALNHDEQVKVISKAHVFVNLSARTSGFEPSLLEAMAQKKVVIGSEMSPMAAMIEHGLEGFLVRPADVTEITELLLAVFEERLPTDQIGDAARAKIASLFDPEKMVVETLKAYRSILQATGRYKRPEL